MPRIAGVDLPKNKRILTGLTYIYGIGPTSAKRILKDAVGGEDGRADALTGEEVDRIWSVIEKNCKVEGDLRMEVQMAIKRLMDLGSYRGLRHRRGLPARGQRTRTNARTRKGPRRGPVASKKKAAAKK